MGLAGRGDYGSGHGGVSKSNSVKTKQLNLEIEPIEVYFRRCESIWGTRLSMLLHDSDAWTYLFGQCGELGFTSAWVLYKIEYFSDAALAILVRQTAF
jgi:hypothetical protein